MISKYLKTILAASVFIGSSSVAIAATWTVDSIEGMATLIRQGEEPRPLELDDVIMPGDQIVTDLLGVVSFSGDGEPITITGNHDITMPLQDGVTIADLIGDNIEFIDDLLEGDFSDDFVEVDVVDDEHDIGDAVDDNDNDNDNDNDADADDDDDEKTAEERAAMMKAKAEKKARHEAEKAEKRARHEAMKAETKARKIAERAEKKAKHVAEKAKKSEQKALERAHKAKARAKKRAGKNDD
ncbi:MAG: hypothetical protein HRU29_14565 [Rhizobiales bacterium]|nr:hypothetical protein [Hyphomicrobiales bacterium]NRB15618.1 hypothetical protein [Hyphomicrobiales bacterium]